MFSKFNHNITQVPLVEQHLRFQIDSLQGMYSQELSRARQEAASLYGKLQQAEKQLDEFKPLKMYNSKESFWSLSKAARFRRKRRIAQNIERSLAILPKEFVPLEVSFL